MNRQTHTRDESAPDAGSPDETTSGAEKLRQLEEQCPEAMEYVNQLIARMNTSSSSGPGATDATATVPPARSASRPDPMTERAAADDTMPSVAKAVALPPYGATRREGDATPTSSDAARRPPRAADLSTDLRRLREAANLTATSALQAYEVQSSVRKAFSEFLMAVTCIATSLVLVKLAQHTVSIAYGCAVLTLVQAAFATWRYFKATETLTRERGEDPTLGLAKP